MNYKFHPDALEEYREAAIWYANREQELAHQFIASIEDAINRVVVSPTRWRVIDEMFVGVLLIFSLRNSLHGRRQLHTYRGGNAFQS